MQSFVDSLKKELNKELPGTEIQWKMASLDRFKKNFPLTPSDNTRIAAVLILLYPHKNSFYIPFIQRPDYEGVHGGQISFPGGKKESFDQDIIGTALRESREEIGVDTEKIIVFGTITPLFIPVSNMLVTPVIGWTDERPVFKREVKEVDYVFDADLKILLDPEIIKSKPMQVRGEEIVVKYFSYNGKVIWGATAMILNELLTIINRFYKKPVM